VRTLYLLIFITLLNHSVFAGTRVAGSLYAISLGATPFTVGVLMALYAMLPMLFAVSMGRWTDRVGARAPMLIGSVAIGSGAILPFLWPGMSALYAASVLVGSGFMMYQVAAQHIVGYIGKPEDRPVNFSLSALGFSISGFIGPMLAGFGIDEIGYIATFAVLAGFPLMPLAVLGLNKLHLPQPHAHASPPDPRHRVADLLRHRELRPVFVTSGLLAAAWDMFTFAIPIYGSRIGLSASSIGLVLGAFSAATFVIRGLLPAISRRLTAWPLLAASLAIAAGSFLLFPLFERAGCSWPWPFSWPGSGHVAAHGHVHPPQHGAGRPRRRGRRHPYDACQHKPNHDTACVRCAGDRAGNDPRLLGDRAAALGRQLVREAPRVESTHGPRSSAPGIHARRIAREGSRRRPAGAIRRLVRRGSALRDRPAERDDARYRQPERAPFCAHRAAQGLRRPGIRLLQPLPQPQGARARG